MTGSGKSYTVGRIIERLVALHNGTVVVFDPHGEYGRALQGGKLQFNRMCWCRVLRRSAHRARTASHEAGGKDRGLCRDPVGLQLIKALTGFLQVFSLGGQPTGAAGWQSLIFRV